MKLITSLLSVFIFLMPVALVSQSSSTASSLQAKSLNSTASGAVSGGSGVRIVAARTSAASPVKPFSRIAFGGGIGMMGVNIQAATNLNRHLNLRGVGNVFDYSVDNISTNGFNVSGKVNMATAGVALDYYPFPGHGFRLSPGMLFYNQNAINASGVVASGESINLDGTDYYSADPAKVPGATPITVDAQMGLNARKQAFTMTTGWGNMISRKGGHWSFPVEIGAAFVGEPTIGVNLSGWACNSYNQSAATCANLASTSSAITAEVNKSLAQQISTWKSDLAPLKVYPIFNFGITYNFRIR